MTGREKIEKDGGMIMPPCMEGGVGEASRMASVLWLGVITCDF